jgi:hypothetical protein
MAMSRAQFPEVMGFQEGGLISSFDVMDPFDPENNFSQTPSPSGITAEETEATDTNILELAKALMSPDAQIMAQIQKKPKTAEQYAKELAPFFASPTPTRLDNFYELAGTLGKNLLAADPTAGAFRGLGLGFAEFTEAQKVKRLQRQQLDREVALKAFELAREDEQASTKLLNDYHLERIKAANRAYKPLTFNKPILDASGKPTGQTEKVFVDAFDRVGIEELQALGAEPVDTAAVNINNPVISPEAKQAAQSLIALYDQGFEQADVAEDQQNMIEQFEYELSKLDEDDFGTLASITLTARKLANGLGLINQEDKISSQELINTLGTRIAMNLVALTKGAISNKEMELFLAASPGLGSTKSGAKKQIEYMTRIAYLSAKRQADLTQALKNGEVYNADEPADMKLVKAQAWLLEWRKKNRFLTTEQRRELRDAVNEVPKYIQEQINNAKTQAEKDKILNEYRRQNRKLIQDFFEDNPRPYDASGGGKDDEVVDLTGETL